MAHHVSQVAEQAILLRGDTVLLLYHEREGTYQLPEGRLDEGEDGGEGLIREIREETGFEMRIEEFVLVTTKVIDRKRTIKYAVFYAAKAPEGNIRIEHPHSSYRWASREDLETVAFMFPELKDILIRAFDQRLSFLE